MTRWQRYWFAEGGRYASAIVRIAIASAILLTLARLDNDVSTGDVPGAHTLYRPVGLWMLLGHTPPPHVVVQALWAIAWIATSAMLLGLRTRTATAASFVSALALASLSYASGSTWSHQYNVVFLAQCAFLGSHSGDVWSLDAAIRHFRGLPLFDRPRAYQWSLRLVQVAVAVMFACAAFHKVMHGHFTLRWALSDNLRHQLMMRFDLAGLPRPPLVAWLIDDPWKYRTVAVLNLISQAAPLATVFLVRHPVWRALFGLFFVLETVALAFVVDLWNPWWLPLYAVFVDWDWLLRRRVVESEPPPSWTPPRAARIWIAVFVAYDVVTAIVPALDQRLNTYPFSGFPMFSHVLAKAPYSGHSNYVVVGDHYDVVADPPIDLPTQRWFDHSNRGMWTERDPDKLHRRLTAMWKQAERRYPGEKFQRVRLYVTMFEALAYPAPAQFVLHPIAVLGELDADGTFRTMVGPYEPNKITLHAVNVPGAGDAKLGYYKDDEPVLVPFTGALDGDPVYAVATTPDGTPWLVSSRAAWRWQ
ncbi:MAG TPA: hypothetical protein VIV58_01240 [Kofleriaceae bacterium]